MTANCASMAGVESTFAPTSTTAASPADSFWQVVRHALRGDHYDFTAVALNRAIILLAVPMVLEMVMESLFAITDVFWVSRLGRDAVAVVGITESVMTLILSHFAGRCHTQCYSSVIHVTES